MPITSGPTNPNRRKFLSKVSATALATTIAPALYANTTLPTQKALTQDAVSQAAMVRNGETSPGKLAKEAIARIKKLNPAINAVITPLFDQALARAEQLPAGPFMGVPYLLKDLIDFKGERTTFGSRMMMENISKKSHAFTEAIEQAGLNILGKTNTPEFGLIDTTEPLAFGATKNPWNLSYSTGGSSGGAAAAVASGMVQIAQGSDGGGSVRMPASNCGIFGMKVTRKRNVWNGRIGLSGMAVKGHLSRTVRDSVALNAVTEWKGENAPYTPVSTVMGPSKRRLKIGLHLVNSNGNMPADDVAQATENTATLCRELGHTVTPVALPVDMKAFNKYFMAIWSRVPAGIVQSAGSAAPEVLEPWTLFLADYHARIGAADFEKALPFMDHAQAEMEKLFSSCDVILSPVLSNAPLPIGAHASGLPGKALMADVMNNVGYTPLYNGTGQPAMSVPLNWNDRGLPIGSQFSARLGGERTLFALAYELEQAKPWKHKWAPHSAFHL